MQGRCPCTALRRHRAAVGVSLAMPLGLAAGMPAAESAQSSAVQPPSPRQLHAPIIGSNIFPPKSDSSGQPLLLVSYVHGRKFGK